MNFEETLGNSRDGRLFWQNMPLSTSKELTRKYLAKEKMGFFSTNETEHLNKLREEYESWRILHEGRFEKEFAFEYFTATLLVKTLAGFPIKPTLSKIKKAISEPKFKKLKKAYKKKARFSKGNWVIPKREMPNNLVNINRLEITTAISEIKRLAEAYKTSSEFIINSINEDQYRENVKKLDLSKNILGINPNEKSISSFSYDENEFKRKKSVLKRGVKGEKLKVISEYPLIREGYDRFYLLVSPVKSLEFMHPVVYLLPEAILKPS